MALNIVPLSLMYGFLLFTLLSNLTLSAFIFPPDSYEHGFYHLHQAVLDEDGNFHLHWEHSENTIIFECQVRTNGYIGFGLSPKGQMESSDIFIGWVSNGKAYGLDGYVELEHYVTFTEHQDWEILHASENSTHTIIRVERKLNTCDPRDREITSDTARVIFAWGENDPISENSTHHCGVPPEMNLQYHGGTSRGVKSLLLLDSHMRASDLPANTNIHEFRNPNISLPNSETVYWCQAFRLPSLERKHHIIKFEPIVAPEQTGVVHHIIVYACYHDVPAELDGYGEFCTSASMPTEVGKCITPLMAWAVGGQAFVFPPNTGFSIGMEDDPTFLVMETHFDNPTNHADILDSSGIRIFYTSNLRPHDAGMLAVGHEMTPYMMIPPGLPEFRIRGYCAKECLNEVLKEQPGGIKAIGVLLHSHMLGSAVQTKHFRDDTELAPLASDMAYDYNYQEGRYIPEEVSILPGDYLTTECVYDSTNRTSLTHGGLSMRDEMCMSYVLYYPKVPLTFCTSSPPVTDVIKVSGVSSVYWGPDIVIFPKPYQGLTLTQAMDNVDWSDPDIIHRYTKDISGSEIVARCLYCNSNGTYKTDRNVVKLAPIRNLYQQIDVCANSTSSKHRLDFLITLLCLCFLSQHL